MGGNYTGWDPFETGGCRHCHWCHSNVGCTMFLPVLLPSGSSPFWQQRIYFACMRFGYHLGFHSSIRYKIKVMGHMLGKCLHLALGTSGHLKLADRQTSTCVGLFALAAGQMQVVSGKLWCMLCRGSKTIQPRSRRLQQILCWAAGGISRSWKA